MKRSLVITAIIALSLIQLAAISQKIFVCEKTLKNGEIHLFKAAPVDPYDAFRGRYVALSEEDLQFEIPTAQGEKYQPGAKIWLEIKKGEDGFSRFVSIGGEKFSAECVQGRVRYATEKRYLYHHVEVGPPVNPELYEGVSVVTVEPPFSHFYMNEKLAPEAETAYRGAAGAKDRAASISVRVLDGMGVIEELYIDGKPIQEVLAGEKP